MLKQPRCFVHISTHKTKMILVVLADVIYSKHALFDYVHFIDCIFIV